MPLKILICGAGIAGNALAFWLSKLGHSVTVIERTPSLRASGLQIDLRGAGIEVLRRMGLEEAFRKKIVEEQGLRLVDKKGKQWGYFPANKSGSGLQSFTTDYEIMRGDFCRLLFDACKEKVEFRFGGSVVGISQSEEEVEVRFSDGNVDTFDLVVGADGLWSRTRRIMLGVDVANDDANPGYHPLNVYAGYCTVSRDIDPSEGYDANAFVTTGSRGIMTRRHDPQWYQAYVFCNPASSVRLQNAERGDVDAEKHGMADVFRGAGWDCDRILQGVVQSDDFYCERMGVIKLDQWYRGRVALAGDAAHCPSAMTGMGTSSAMAGVYILAGEIGRHCGTDSGSSKQNITVALQEYDRKFRPFMDEIQKGLTDRENYMDRFPSSSFGIGCLYYMFWIASLLRLDVLAQWLLRESVSGWELPKYPEMDVMKGD
ncbi:uncharacterized protein APUU_71077A [Aspergillus puulaauensis]|uniref:FAD-binding domain-containing protein n=1 Tax=Aspergillus puulaauensis TaxID=1220207 RepID=A0A7R7XXX4_9EURO|nr:uncharacterized protein APUU_71077A [Aspergillus puulaauensis]BCS29507.1 hypothetical protein APUU_71077A [Aspergillus puulaauensis]